MKRSVLFNGMMLLGILRFLCSCIFFRPSPEKLFARAEKNKPYDVIIVPGVPYDSLVGKWDDIMKIRIYWSHYLYTKGITRNIIYSGSSVYTPYVEGQIMALYAQKLGLPRENIFIENAAEHSTENLYYSYYMAKKLGFTKIAVATDPLQSKLLMYYPPTIRIKVDFIPIIYDTLRSLDMKDISIDPEEAKVKDFESLLDRESRFKRFLGTLGKNLKRNDEDVRNRKKAKK